MSSLSNAEKRAVRIVRLVDELRTKATTDTDAARHRCIQIAGELIELFKAQSAQSHLPEAGSTPAAVHKPPAAGTKTD